MGEFAMPLRQAANLLGHSPQSPDYQTLLGVLRSGYLKAGFHFPAGDPPLWVNIPVEFWTTVNSGRLRAALRFVNGRSSSGAYQVRLADFVKEIGASISQKAGVDNVELWSAALSATRQEYEVGILESEWARFAREHHEYISPPSAETRGAKQKKGWRNLSVIISVYMVEHHQHPRTHSISNDAISAAILEKAKKAQIDDLPTSATIKTVVSEILKELEANSSK
jgi:hypothetical protein